jgi:hypothetical protein
MALPPPVALAIATVSIAVVSEIRRIGQQAGTALGMSRAFVGSSSSRSSAQPPR